MALPTKSTPDLVGEEAEKFREKMARAEAGEGRVSPEEYERIMRIWKIVKANEARE